MNKIDLIQTFCKVAQYCNFTGAAKSLNISATVVSKQIKHLELEQASAVVSVSKVEPSCIIRVQSL